MDALIYGQSLDTEARSARQAAAAARVVEIDTTLATVPMLPETVAALEAERILAHRYSAVDDPGALEYAARGLTTRIQFEDGSVIVVTPHGVELPASAVWTTVRL